MSRWFRHYAGMMRDDKLVSVAIKSKQAVERVVWVWGAILESAAEIDDNGRFDVDPAEIAYFLRADEADVCAVIAGLERAGRVASGAVVKWGDRQFQSDRKNPTSRGSDRYVYFVGTTWDAAVKIGFSKNPWARAKELQTGNVAKVQVLAHFRCEANSEVEIHNLLGAQRHAGEWFILNDQQSKVVLDASTSSLTYENLLPLLRSATSVGPETKTETETETDIPEANASGRSAIDFQAAIFNSGKALLKAAYGCDDRQAGSTLGRIRKEAKDDALVLHLLADCEAKGISDPTPWLLAAVKQRKANGLPSTQRFPGNSTLRELAERSIAGG